MMPSLEDQVAMKQAQQKDKHDFHARPREFGIGQHAMVKNMRSGPPWIPGTVIQQIGLVTYLVDTGDGRPWKCHIDQMKEFRGTQAIDQPGITDSQSLDLDIFVPVTNTEGNAPGVPTPQTEEPPLNDIDASGPETPEPSDPPNHTPGTIDSPVESSTASPTGTQQAGEMSRTPPPSNLSTPHARKSYPKRQHHPPNWYGRNHN